MQRNTIVRSKSALSDCFSKTTRDRQKQLFLASALCVFFSIGHVGIKENASLAWIDLHAALSPVFLPIAIGISTLYILLSFLAIARPEARVGEGRAKLFAIESQQRCVTFRNEANEILARLDAREARVVDAAKALMRKIQEEGEENEEFEKSLEPTLARRKELRVQLERVDLEYRESRRDSLFEESLKIKGLINETLDAENNARESRRQSRSEEISKFLDIPPVPPDDPDLQRYKQHADAIIELEGTVSVVVKNHKYRIRIELFGPTIFAIASLLLLIVSGLTHPQ